MNFKIKLILFVFLSVLFSINTFAQDNPLTQTIRGIVIDQASGSPLSYIPVELLDQPEIKTMTNDEGEFILKNVPIGRQSIQVKLTGYELSILHEILLTSSKEVYLEIPLKEKIRELDEIVIHSQTNKNRPLNDMALVGAHQLSVEEASRYAGGMDDPARLVSSFAGVSPSVGNNGISIHGNAPHLLQWRLEDVEIPNPNHYADISTLGGGVLSSLSSNVLGNSDFFTGAFPAEYGNAVSGVFDMKLRNGNKQKHENTFQAGILGLDFASEGPLSRKHNSSYIFNYRYSTTGLLGNMSDLGQILDYQDLNFKMNFPTKKAGTFSVWGTALIDKFKSDLDDQEDWKYKDDGKKSKATQYMAAAGISHRYFFDNNTQLKTTLATTYFKHTANENIFDRDMQSTPYLDLNRRNTNLILTSSLNKKFSSRFTSKTGFTFTRMSYDMNLDLAPYNGLPLDNISQGKGNTHLISGYTSSSIGLSDRVTLNLGINGQILTLNNHWTLEPRAAIKWQATDKSTLAFAYGLHSRMEKLDVYFVKIKGSENNQVNKDLNFTKAHHLMLSYSYQISDDMNLRIEPYFQQLYDVPVIADSSYSVLNRNDFYVKNALVNKGKGRNIGVDITLEKYLSKGFYYMITTSIFDSRYSGGDGVWRNTKFNRNFIVNTLLGKEWVLGRNKQNILSANIKLTLQGGDRYSPVDKQATLNHPDKEVQYDESKAYSKQFSPMFLTNLSLSYKMNKQRVSHEFFLKVINVTGYKEYYNHEYNLNTGSIEPNRRATALPNIGYKLEF